MLEQIKKINALTGLANKCNSTANLCNALAEKQNAICKAMQKDMEKIEKKHPFRYLFKKEWRILWTKFCRALDRSSYYSEICKRVLEESTDYLALADKQIILLSQINKNADRQVSC